MSKPNRKANPLSIVVARNDAGYIGKDNQLLWRMPSDLRRFRELTIGGVVIMGRKTYDSIGHPLPKRTNIIISRQSWTTHEGCIVVPSFDDALSYARRVGDATHVIGGGEIYRVSLPYVDCIYLTVVHDSGIVGDVLFPELSAKDWAIKKADNMVHHVEDQFPSSFYELHRIKKAGA